MATEIHACVIVDDELASREVLNGFIRKYCPQLEVKGKAASVDEATVLIDRTNPALIFLDIEMPFKSGFDLLQHYGSRTFQVIFVTAYSDHAINAIHVSAVDYLLKPVSIDHLQSAVNKALARIGERDSLDNARVLLENLQANNHADQRVVLPLLDGFEVVRAGDIIRCEADDNFTQFQLRNGERRMICRPLKFYEQALQPLGFARVHRAHMVNLMHVQRYRKGKGGVVVMADGSEVPVSEAHKNSFLAAMGFDRS
jgi:two-component system, LytTR family, response regulator